MRPRATIAVALIVLVIGALWGLSSSQPGCTMGPVETLFTTCGSR